MQALFGKAFGVYFLQKVEGREEEIGLKSRHNVEVNGWWWLSPIRPQRDVNDFSWPCEMLALEKSWWRCLAGICFLIFQNVRGCRRAPWTLSLSKSAAALRVSTASSWSVESPYLREERRVLCRGSERSPLQKTRFRSLSLQPVSGDKEMQMTGGKRPREAPETCFGTGGSKPSCWGHHHWLHRCLSSKGLSTWETLRGQTVSLKPQNGPLLDCFSEVMDPRWTSVCAELPFREWCGHLIPAIWWCLWHALSAVGT